MLMGKRGVSSAVRELVLSMPSVVNCLEHGIVNFSALARVIAADIKKATGIKGVSEGAIKMSILRISRKLREAQRAYKDRVLRVIAGSVLRLEAGLAVVTIRREAVFLRLNELVQLLEESRFFQLTQGVNTFSVVISDEHLKRLVSTVRERNVVSLIKNQSALIIISPKDILTTPGVVSYITKLLSWNGINITQVISCHLDTILIVSHNDALKAYKILDEAIINSRRLLGVKSA
ncbi:MAG: hypothetical protein B6U73_02330 [Desulfurococcales archaeon ex4484_204]|nr:MAG: hypothetical protein B6U73_02330 [Desulfurococcales archaeon ex4484_204]